MTWTEYSWSSVFTWQFCGFCTSYV